MTPQSAKAKGRNLQKFVCEKFLALGRKYGLEEGDILSRSMGAAGVDIILSPAAMKVFGNIAIECKNQEALNVVKIFTEHAAKYKHNFPLLIHKKNHTEPMVTLRFSDFLDIFKNSI